MIDRGSLSFLSRAEFQTYIDSHPELTSYLVRTLARRLRGADDGLAAALIGGLVNPDERALTNKLLLSCCKRRKAGGRANCAGRDDG
jgi:hypothetical protein